MKTRLSGWRGDAAWRERRSPSWNKTQNPPEWWVLITEWLRRVVNVWSHVHLAVSERLLNWLKYKWEMHFIGTAVLRVIVVAMTLFGHQWNALRDQLIRNQKCNDGIHPRVKTRLHWPSVTFLVEVEKWRLQHSPKLAGCCLRLYRKSQITQFSPWLPPEVLPSFSSRAVLCSRGPNPSARQRLRNCWMVRMVQMS